jgi:hypothetical protein
VKGETRTSGSTLRYSTGGQKSCIWVVNRWPSAGYKMERTTENHQPAKAHGPCPPLRAAALSCYWKLWLEAMDKGFKGDKGQVWDKFTALTMSSIPEDIRNDRDLLSMTDLLDIMDILPPEKCYLNALSTTFHSHFAFGDTKSSTEEISRRVTAMKVIAETQQAYPLRARDGREMSHEASPDGHMDMFPQAGFGQEETQAPPCRSRGHTQFFLFLFRSLAIPRQSTRTRNILQTFAGGMADDRVRSSRKIYRQANARKDNRTFRV